MTVIVTMSDRDAKLAVDHLRYLVDREKATDVEHAKANLSARYVTNLIESALRGEGGAA